MENTYSFTVKAALWTPDRSGEMIDVDFPEDKAHYLNLLPFQNHMEDLLDRFGFEMIDYTTKGLHVKVTFVPTENVDREVESAGEVIDFVRFEILNDIWRKSDPIDVITEDDLMDYLPVKAKVLYGDEW